MPENKPKSPTLPPPSSFWPTSTRVPDTFPSARETPTVVNTPARIQAESAPGVLGFYRPQQNVIALSSGQPPESLPGMHETGHAIWYQDLTPQQRDQWITLHGAELKRKGSSLSAVQDYPWDPAHSFAQAYGIYAANPSQLQNESPDAYNLIRSMAKFEYKRKK